MVVRSLHKRFMEGHEARLLTTKRIPSQYSNMSCPRAGPVGNLVRSTLKNGSIFMPSGPMWASRTQNVLRMVQRAQQRIRDVHALAVAGDVHHVRLHARDYGARQLRVLEVAHVPLLDLVGDKAADVQEAIVGRLAQVGRQLAGVAELAGRVLAVAGPFPDPDRVVEGTVREAVIAAVA